MSPASVVASPPSFNRTDAGNGEYFARMYGERLRYDHRRGRWLVWDGHWWREDDARSARRLAKEAARSRYARATSIGDLRDREAEARFAIGSENRQRLDAMLLAAQTEPPIADAGDRWDADPWLLGVATGVVDLRAGSLRPGTPEDRITRHSAVAFDPNAACPRWRRFLDEVFASDDELIGYLARAVGYSLTGDTAEQCLFTCHGTGSNGKSVFLTVIREIAGSYAANTPFSTFELRGRSGIPNDLAALAGARLVTASETAEDTRLNESRLKALTGGDPITARFLNREFFTYQPVAKFWLAVNHKPKVTDDSYGFWRRVRLIPFSRQFATDADPHLLDTLRSELPGILGWAVDGALAWQDRGLEPPAAVATATDAYRIESDPLADFIESACVVGNGFVVGATEAHRAYRAWAIEAGLSEREILSSTRFGTRMKSRFVSDHRRGGNVYLGVGLRSDRTSPSEDVKGWVKGFTRDVAGIEIPAPLDPLTRENHTGAFTPFTPSPGGTTHDEGLLTTGAGLPPPRTLPIEADYPQSAFDPRVGEDRPGARA